MGIIGERSEGSDKSRRCGGRETNFGGNGSIRLFKLFNV